MKNLKEEIKKVKQLIAHDELEEAFHLLKETPGFTYLERELISLQGQLEQLKRQNHQGIIEADRFDTKKNKITLSLLDLLKNHTNKKESGSTFKEVTPDNWFESDSPSLLNRLIKIFGGNRK